MSQDATSDDALGVDVGTFVFLTKENCPACHAFKRQRSVKEALASGDAIEVQPEDPGYDHVREAADVHALPGVVEYTAEGYVPVSEA